MCNIVILLSQIFWSDSGELVCIATEESFFILKYLSEKVAAAQETHEGVTEDGIEDAFEVTFYLKSGIRLEMVEARECGKLSP